MARHRRMLRLALCRMAARLIVLQVMMALATWKLQVVLFVRVMRTGPAHGKQWRQFTNEMQSTEIAHQPGLCLLVI